MMKDPLRAVDLRTGPNCKANHPLWRVDFRRGPILTASRPQGGGGSRHLRTSPAVGEKARRPVPRRQLRRRQEGSYRDQPLPGESLRLTPTSLPGGGTSGLLLAAPRASPNQWLRRRLRHRPPRPLSLLVLPLTVVRGRVPAEAPLGQIIMGPAIPLAQVPGESRANPLPR